METAILFGDVHGESKQLEELIQVAKARYGDDVQFYSLGDIIDRGPDSSGVLDLCVQHNVKGVLGNHELWLRHFALTGQFDPFALADVMGGKATLLSYGITSTDEKDIEHELDLALPAHHRDYLKNLPIWRRLEVDGQVYRLIHAGMKRADAMAFLPTADAVAQKTGMDKMDALVESMARIQPDPLLWRGPNLYRNFNLYTFEDDSTQVFGHLPQKHPKVNKKWIAIDTGCGTCHPYWLSAVVLPQRETITIGQFGGEVPEHVVFPPKSTD